VRVALLFGVAFFVALAVVALIVAGPGSQTQGMTPVLVATSDIRPATRITADQLGTTYLRASDPTLLGQIVAASDRSRLVGQVAAVPVAAGSLIPSTVTVRDTYWVASIPVKRRPASLQAGDHVAVLVSSGGSSTSSPAPETIFLQDVRVLGVGENTADLWLPPEVVAPLESFGDRGGVVLAKMAPGAMLAPTPSPSPSR
jgi:Flp pilus assembly protein CpaB